MVHRWGVAGVEFPLFFFFFFSEVLVKRWGKLIEPCGDSG